jgi:hypothetical protein
MISVRKLLPVRIGIAAILLIPGTLLVIWDEVLLSAPIILLVELLGFWPGYVAFCLIWGGMGFFSLMVWVRVEPWCRERIPWLFGKKERPEPEEFQPKNWREKLVVWAARIARFFGAITATVVIGPILAWSIYKLLGYSLRQIYAMTFISTWIFGAIWVPFYGLGVWGLGLDRLF